MTAKPLFKPSQLKHKRLRVDGSPNLAPLAAAASCDIKPEMHTWTEDLGSTTIKQESSSIELGIP